MTILKTSDGMVVLSFRCPILIDLKIREYAEKENKKVSEWLRAVVYEEICRRGGFSEDKSD